MSNEYERQIGMEDENSPDFDPENQKTDREEWIRCYKCLNMYLVSIDWIEDLSVYLCDDCQEQEIALSEGD